MKEKKGINLKLPKKDPKKDSLKKDKTYTVDVPVAKLVASATHRKNDVGELTGKPPSGPMLCMLTGPAASHTDYAVRVPTVVVDGVPWQGVTFVSLSPHWPSHLKTLPVARMEGSVPITQAGNPVNVAPDTPGAGGQQSHV